MDTSPGTSLDRKTGRTDCSAPRIRDRHLRIGGATVFARIWTPSCAQERAPVLLFHDSLGSVELWRDFPARLAQASGRAVIAYDRPGFGLSSAREDRLSMDFVAEEARSVVPVLCRELGLARLVACGHSVGGGMAVETAAQHPDRCEALVTIAAQAFVEDRTIAGIEAARRAFADPAALGRLARYHGEKARWVMDAWIGTWLSPGFAGWTLDAATARIRCPILAIHGERDEYGSPAHPARIAATPHGRTLILPDTGHVPHRDNPEALLDAIVHFLAT